MCSSSIQNILYSYVCCCCAPAGRLFNRLAETIHHFGINCFRAADARVSPNLVLNNVTRRSIGSPFSPLIVRRLPGTPDFPLTPRGQPTETQENMHFVPSDDPTKESAMEIVIEMGEMKN